MDIFTLSLLVNLVVIGVLWWAAARSKTARSFWQLVAAGWSLNLLGNLIWIGYEMARQQSLPPLSPVDSLYLGRYLLVGWAFWVYPAPWPGRRGLEITAAMLLMAVVAWFSLFRPVLASTAPAWPDFLGVAIYPVLDAGLVYAALRRFLELKGDWGRPAFGLLLLAMLCYGAANWINFTVRMTPAERLFDWASLFWLLTDLLTGLAAMVWQRQEKRVLPTGSA